MYAVTDNGVLKKIETWQLILPLHDNDGNAFEESKIESILDHIALTFPGLTMINCTGRWRGKDRTHIDKNLQVLIDALPLSTEESAAFFVDLKIDLQARLGQEKIYVTKESSKEEIISFEEFFAEVGVDTDFGNDTNAKKRTAQQIVRSFDYVMHRMGYETIAIRRDRENKKFTWERRLCGIKLLSILDDPYPDEAQLIGADQIEMLAQNLFSDSCILIGHYEYQRYAVDRLPIRPFVKSTIVAAPDFKCGQYMSPEGQVLTVRQFVERFTMAIVSNVAVLRDHGFRPSEIRINVGRDGSMQRTESDLGNCVFINPASIPDNPVQEEIMRCLHLCLDQMENGTLDQIALQQAKALNAYTLRRAFLKWCPPE